MPHRAYDCPDCLQRLTGLRDCYDVRRRLYLAYVLFVSTCKIAKYMLSQQSHKGVTLGEYINGPLVVA
jgi:hypothetical protein